MHVFVRPAPTRCVINAAAPAGSVCSGRTPLRSDDDIRAWPSSGEADGSRYRATGSAFPMLRDREFEVIGIDLSSRIIAFAKQRYADDRRIQLSRGDAEFLPFATTRRVHELPRVPARPAVATGEPGTVPVVDAHVSRSNRGMHRVSVHGGGAKATMTSADAVS